MNTKLTGLHDTFEEFIYDTLSIYRLEKCKKYISCKISHLFVFSQNFDVYCMFEYIYGFTDNVRNWMMSSVDISMII